MILTSKLRMIKNLFNFNKINKNYCYDRKMKKSHVKLKETYKINKI